MNNVHLYNFTRYIFFKALLITVHMAWNYEKLQERSHAESQHTGTPKREYDAYLYIFHCLLLSDLEITSIQVVLCDLMESSTDYMT